MTKGMCRLRRWAKPLYHGYLTIVAELNALNRIGVTQLTEVNLELVNVCNLRCRWCSLDHSKRREFMSPELMDRCFNNLLSDRRLRGVRCVKLWNGGEVLLHPHLREMLEIVRKHKARAAGGGRLFPRVEFLTNGTLLTENVGSWLLDMNTLDLVVFSVDGGTKRAYEAIRSGAKWETTQGNILEFCRMNRGRVPTKICCIVEAEKPLHVDWMELDFKRLLQTVDSYELRHPHNWDGSIELGLPEEAKRKPYAGIRCYFLDHSLVVLPNGDVTMCCADLNSRGVIGNLHNKDLFSLYNGPTRRRTILYLRTGRVNRIPLCRDCTGY